MEISFRVLNSSVCVLWKALVVSSFVGCWSHFLLILMFIFPSFLFSLFIFSLLTPLESHGRIVCLVSWDQYWGTEADYLISNHDCLISFYAFSSTTTTPYQQLNWCSIGSLMGQGIGQIIATSVYPFGTVRLGVGDTILPH